MGALPVVCLLRELQNSSKWSQHVLPTWEDKGASMVSKLKHVSSEPFEAASCQPHEAILNFYDLFQSHICVQLEAYHLEV